MADFPEITVERFSPPLDRLAKEIDRWLETTLSDYLTSAAQPTAPLRVKEIHDPIAQRVGLRACEVYILDSPLVQRLRYIKQLGVTHFLFPTTGYSRFEHTLGAVGRADEILQALRRTEPKVSTPSLRDESFEQALRLAALFHDVGHCPFSHVSEKFYQNYPGIQDSISQLTDLLNMDGEVSPSELLSILIVTSPVVTTMLGNSRVPITSSELSGDALQNFIAACIAGAEEATAPYSYFAQIINGPIDCDKLDYLARDAHMAGTPIALDTGRLISKLRLATKQHRVTGASTHVLAIDISGARAVDELLASRVFLFDKLYFHHKVLAAEELVRQGLETLRSKYPEAHNPTQLLKLGDEQLLDINFDATDITVDPNAPEYLSARQLFDRVRYRRLPKRVFAFAMRFLEKAPKYLQKLASGGRKSEIRRGKTEADQYLRSLERDPSERTKLASEVRALVDPAKYNGNVYVAQPKPGRVAATGRIAAVDADGEVIDDGGNPAAIDFLFAANKWVEAYAANKLTGYVFADTSSESVYLAAERVFVHRGISFDARAWTMGKIARSQIDKLRMSLTDRSDAESANWLCCRLSPDYLDQPRTRREIAEVATKLAPMHSDVHLNAEQWVTAWLFQFPDADLQDSALRLLKHVTMLDRAERSRLFGEFIASGKSNGAWSILAPVVKGDRQKSSSLIAYFQKDLGAGHPPIKLLTQWTPAELKKQGRIVFVDDVLGTGTQSTTLISSWFKDKSGIVSTRDADNALKKTHSELLRNMPVVFYFLIAWDEGVEHLVDCCQKLGFKNVTVERGLRGDDLQFHFDGADFASDLSRNRLRAFLQAKGEELLAHRKDFSAADQKLYAFGYHGKGATIALSYSTPTITITPLWETSSDVTSPWLPVIPRYPVETAKQINGPDANENK